jgi:hypothetical protein
LFARILRRIGELRPPPGPAPGVRRSIVVHSRTLGAVRLDDNEICISGARRASVTGFGVPEHHGDGSALPSKKLVLISLHFPSVCAPFAPELP